MAGQMQASQSMTNQTMTIMFADIEGFSTGPPFPSPPLSFCFGISPPGLILRLGFVGGSAAAICEAVPAEELAEVCTEYFEVMCGTHGAPPSPPVQVGACGRARVCVIVCAGVGVGVGGCKGSMVIACRCV